MLDLVGEVLERADGDALLGRVLRRAVRLGHVGDHHLSEKVCNIRVRCSVLYYVPKSTCYEVVSRCASEVQFVDKIVTDLGMSRDKLKL